MHKCIECLPNRFASHAIATMIWHKQPRRRLYVCVCMIKGRPVRIDYNYTHVSELCMTVWTNQEEQMLHQSKLGAFPDRRCDMSVVT